MTVWFTDEYMYMLYFFPEGKEEIVEKRLKKEGLEIMEGMGVTNKDNLLYYTVRRRNQK